MKILAWCLSMLLIPAVSCAAESPWVEPATGMAFVSVPKGCFQMGSPGRVEPYGDIFWDRTGNPDINVGADEGPAHEVCLDAFWMGKKEVTRAEWHAVMGGESPGDLGDLPVSRVTWEDAQLFVVRLAEKNGNVRFRLPSEAEWEYACRGGKKGAEPPADGGSLPTVAWVHTRDIEPHPTGKLGANEFGLHDMIGNVWEWTQDYYSPTAYKQHKLYNPRMEAKSSQRVIRGGGFRTEIVQSRCTARGHYPPDKSLVSVGFRVVREP